MWGAQRPMRESWGPVGVHWGSMRSRLRRGGWTRGTVIDGLQMREVRRVLAGVQAGVHLIHGDGLTPRTVRRVAARIHHLAPVIWKRINNQLFNRFSPANSKYFIYKLYRRIYISYL